MKGKMKKQTLVWAVMLALTGSVYTASAEMAEVSMLPEVVVTATRVESELAKTAADVTVITREEIENHHYTSVEDALRSVPGIITQTYGGSGETYATNGLLINGTNNIVVLVDGMRVNTNGNTLGKFQASELVDMNAIERIEVLRGASSTLYGSDAQGGVINIITRKVKDGEVRTTVAYEGGMYDKHKFNLNNSGREKGIYWNVALQKHKTGDFKDGWGREVIDRVESESVNVKLGKELGEKGRVEFTFSSYDADYTRPGGQWETPGPAKGVKYNKRFSFTHEYHISDNLTNTFKVFHNQNKLDDNKEKPASRWTMDLRTYGFSEQLTYYKGTHTMIGGIDYYKDRIDHYLDAYSSYPSKSSISSGSIFIQDEWRFNSKWKSIAGIRFEHNSEYGNETSPAFSLQYEPSDDVLYYASYKQYFNAPDLYKLYSSPYGNKDLKPEKGYQYEIGVKKQLPKDAFLNISAWYRKSSDIIVFVFGPTSQYQNVDKEEAHGITVGWEKPLNKHWDLNLGYTYTHIKAQTGRNINRDGTLPVSAWNVGLRYHADKVTAGIYGKGTIARAGRVGDPYADKITSFWVWDAEVNYQATKDLTVFATINNIFDQLYTERTYDLDPNGDWYSRPGRNITAGVKYSF